MVSILIPLYNFDSSALFRELTQQAQDLDISFEIRAYEDGSTQYTAQNREAALAQGVIYQHCPLNEGRARMRNRLAQEARYEHLIFMDCDVKPSQDDFLLQYVKRIQQNSYDVISGGRKREGSANEISPECRLNWKVNHFREGNDTRSAGHFYSNNFLIRKSIFQSIQFEEALHRYGHEDTLFGLELHQQQLIIEYLPNPVVHVDLVSNTEFLDKTEESIENLLWLMQHRLTLEQQKRITLLKYYHYVRRLRLTSILSWCFTWSKPLTRKWLEKKYPSLYLLDWYKLGYFCYRIKDQATP